VSCHALQAITILSVWWLVAKAGPRFYVKHRVPLVLVLKSVLALGVLHITNDSPRLIWKPHRGAELPALLVFQSAMIAGVVHLPALCVGLPLPFWLQLGWAFARAAAFLLGLCTRGRSMGKAVLSHAVGYTVPLVPRCLL
jgi:hypothetical protein